MCPLTQKSTYFRILQHIQVHEGAISKYFKPGPLAYALQGLVVRGIERLQTIGTIVSVIYSERVVLIVPLVKMKMDAFEYAETTKLQ